ncbi:MAG: AAA family ATPase [Nitratiruptor sp.]|nr:AAA family ATPase [Nitratiruptor sp.]NPA83369.1 ATP-binding protein [Campylobacterota bacterium]
MDHLKAFLKASDITKTTIFPYLQCTEEEGTILREILRRYLLGEEGIVVFDLLDGLSQIKEFDHLRFLPSLRRLLDLGWVALGGFASETIQSDLELLHKELVPTPLLFRLLEAGRLEPPPPQLSPYKDHLDYLQDQFRRIELYWQRSQRPPAPKLALIEREIAVIEEQIDKRLQMTSEPMELERLFDEVGLDWHERLLFTALLREEYMGGDGGLREMNALLRLISSTTRERLLYRSLLEDGGKLVAQGLLDYEEVFPPFGGSSRTFFIPDGILRRLLHPERKRSRKRLKLQNLIKEQDIFELIEPTTSLEDVVLHPQTRATLEALLRQMDPKVIQRLKRWGIKKHRNIEARIIFYGPPGTGKTLTALSLAKSLKRPVLSFDCSKILSMYVGESEKNVRKIFDTFHDIRSKVAREPVLLLNEADQFLSQRSYAPGNSADKMHNQMQNIFLEQIERFEGILIATTNLLETIDPAFSRRFNYKIEFKRPTFEERIKLWEKMLPKEAEYAPDFAIEKLARYELTGGQIHLVIKNTAYKVAVREEPIFTMADFIEEIERERSGAFGDAKSMGFLQ